jgi:RNA polymerase sigma factor (sigma-70 family)
MFDPKPTVPIDALTAEQFAGLLQRLDSQPDRAGEKYEGLRWKLVKFFQWSSCSGAEDLADETLNRVARKLQTGDETILHVEAYTWGVAKQIRREGQKRDGKTVRFSDMPDHNFASDAGAAIDDIHKKIQSRKEQRCLGECLGRLSLQEQELFLAYRVDKGHYAKTRKELAKKFELSPGALRVRVIRLREKLEKCIARCLGC